MLVAVQCSYRIGSVAPGPARTPAPETTIEGVLQVARFYTGAPDGYYRTEAGLEAETVSALTEAGFRPRAVLPFPTAIASGIVIGVSKKSYCPGCPYVKSCLLASLGMFPMYDSESTVWVVDIYADGRRLARYEYSVGSATWLWLPLIFFFSPERDARLKREGPRLMAEALLRDMKRDRIQLSDGRPKAGPAALVR